MFKRRVNKRNVWKRGNPFQKFVVLLFLEIYLRIASAKRDRISGDKLLPGILCLKTKTSCKCHICPKVLLNRQSKNLCIECLCGIHVFYDKQRTFQIHLRYCLSCSTKYSAKSLGIGAVMQCQFGVPLTSRQVYPPSSRGSRSTPQ